MSRLLVVFLDGVGIGGTDPEVNPFLTARLPSFEALFGGIPDTGRPVRSKLGSVSNGTHLPAALTFPVDANLGVEGTPQSGTGQTTLLTGQNGAELFGRHFGPWVPTALRPIVREESFLARALAAGHRVAFANAYPEGWPGERGGRRVAGPPLAAQGAGLLTRTHHDLASGQAVSSEMTNGGWKKYLGFNDLPDVTPEQAGRTLAGIAADHDLTLYAHYSTDSAGHRGGMEGAIAALEKVDAFLGGLVSAAFDADGRSDGLGVSNGSDGRGGSDDSDHLAGSDGSDGSDDSGTAGEQIEILICSDHGNIEDVTTGHTRNPSLGALIGAGAADFDSAQISGLADIPGFLLNRLSMAEQ